MTDRSLSEKWFTLISWCWIVLFNWLASEIQFWMMISALVVVEWWQISLQTDVRFESVWYSIEDDAWRICSNNNRELEPPFYWMAIVQSSRSTSGVCWWCQRGKWWTTEARGQAYTFQRGKNFELFSPFADGLNNWTIGSAQSTTWSSSSLSLCSIIKTTQRKKVEHSHTRKPPQENNWNKHPQRPHPQ